MSEHTDGADELTASELEANAYNEAADDAAAGDQAAAAAHVLDRPSVYNDTEDDRVRAKARAIQGTS